MATLQTVKPLYRGIVPPLVTPLVDRDKLDYVGTQRLLEHVIKGGVHGVFILGTTGEAPSLSYRLRREFIKLVSETVDHRVPVFVGVTDTSLVESLRLAESAKDSGADAVVLSTPYYFPAGQTELIQYIADIVQEVPLPMMLYNMPSLTKVWFEIDTLRSLAQHREIIGVKDSSGDMKYFQQMLSLKEVRPDWSMFIGPEHLTAEAIAMGGDGGVNGGANIYPQLFVDLYNAAMTQKSQQVEVLSQRVNRLQQIYSVGKYASRFIKATKCALSINGICSDHMAEPFNHFMPPQRAEVSDILSRM
ncbi:MAG: dihydrodipicolinate synthase family protein [Planctomycetaceae bacterium TMED240]|nr:dihydrodipicolinate synthase family protein [Rhodopirellula sp.]OUX07440.1 MAG: dihydrodipicolinate synthase family protein [Planctomycetaceae bacterium TMED240]